MSDLKTCDHRGAISHVNAKGTSGVIAMKIEKMDEGNDLDLVRLCLRGEEAGTSGLMDRYGPHLLAAGLNVLMNREDAEDVVQETFCRAFRHLDRFDGARSFRTWLFAIWYRRCMDVFRKRSRFRRFFAKFAAESRPARWTSNPPVKDEGPLPVAVLGVLSPRERTVLSLWAGDDRPLKDIAAIMNCSPGTVRVHLFRARKKARALLEGTHERLPHR